jgi:hypothetical protein
MQIPMKIHETLIQIKRYHLLFFIYYQHGIQSFKRPKLTAEHI